KEVDYAIINTNDYDRYRPIFPQLKSAFSLTQPQAVRWVFSKSGDNSLYIAAHYYLESIKKDNGIQKINQQLYEHIDSINYSSARIFQRHIKMRLPRHQGTFQTVASQYDFDWRLLAAVSYQESAWNAKAVSPTGVRGLMMLTQTTAKEMGVNNRSNPEQSIEGGAAYLRKLINRQPKEMKIEDKIWFGLAAYNAGYGHISDARKIAKSQGVNPYNWRSVKRFIPLLQQPRWYKDTRFGYSLSANQALTYVENIRHYYDLLLWSTLFDQPNTFVSENETAIRSTSI
ncbi:MAG: transglycosylase SLT domain-containing protein, partial [Pseudomonadales bacterium]|nr:transglycosylase SLT domain-containing protein [Pseudomonadales bacterium]